MRSLEEIGSALLARLLRSLSSCLGGLLLRLRTSLSVINNGGGCRFGCGSCVGKDNPRGRLLVLRLKIDSSLIDNGCSLLG